MAKSKKQGYGIRAKRHEQASKSTKLTTKQKAGHKAISQIYREMSK